MRITIAAIGRAKPGPELQLCRQYTQRCGWPIEIKEIAPRGSNTLPSDKRKADEGCKLLAATEHADLRIALDERGKAYSSEPFSALLLDYADTANYTIAFLIGGADGHSKDVLQQSALKMAFGPATWPHMLVRAMLAEQLYRAWTIQAGHPYHRT